MENQKMIARTQPFSSTSTSQQQQQQAPSVKLTSSSAGNFASSPRYHNNSSRSFSHSQFDSARSKNNNKAKGYTGERSRTNGKNRVVHHHHHGRGGYHRQPASNKQDYEVKRCDDRSGNGHTAEKATRHGESASHLLNFTYAPLRSQEGSHRRSSADHWRGSRAKRQVVHTKEQFLQAHCQFVVKAPVTEAEYVENMVEADKMVEWENIEQVILRDEQISTCPICMDIPVAAKITKCAHIYCWPCMLHYLSLTDRAWGRCPICFDSVEEKDFKSVVTKASTKPKVGDEVTFYLMKREREALYVRPKTSWKTGESSRLFNPSDDDADVRYSKLLAATAQYLEDIVEEERRQLVALLNQEDTQSLEASFVQAALDSLNVRLEKMGGSRAVSTAMVEEPQARASLPAEKLLPSVKSAPELKVINYSDAFEEVAGPADASSSTADSPPAETSEVSAVSNEDSISPGLTVLAGSKERVRTVSTASSSDGVETEQIAADLVLPPTGTQPGHSSGSKRTEVYYFYQAADGQHVYLHSINTRILAAQYGSLEMAPSVLTATIVEAEDNSMTTDLRKRLKYLSHLPIYSQFTVCEVVLRPPVVSSACLSHFTEELSQRKRMRNRRLRTETKQYNRAQAEEKRRMGRYPDMSIPLDSGKHFPLTSTGDTSPPPLTDFAPLVDSQPTVEPVANEHSVPSRQHEVPLTTPYSFAQAMKGNGASAAVWPKVQSSYVRSSGSQSTSTRLSESEGEEPNVPSFQKSFSADFNIQDFAKLTTDDGDSKEVKTGKKGGKGKKKKQVLFSTSIQRGNP